VPSKITAKDFERFLPEERDTIAQGLLKYVQFAIMFWRWYRNAYNNDGTLSYVTKGLACATGGCLGSKVVSEGEPDSGDPGSENEDGTGEASDDSREKENPEMPPPNAPVLPPNNPQPPSGGCCDATVKNYEDFFFWEPVKNVDLKCVNYAKTAAIRNGSFYGVNFDSGNDETSTFNKFVSWGQWQGAGSGSSDASATFGNEHGGTVAVSEGRNVLHRVSIFLYGMTNKIYAPGPDGVLISPPLRGRLYYNNSKNHKDFEIKNGGYWGAEININMLQTDGWSGLGEAMRSIKIHFSPFHSVPIDTKPSSTRKFERWPLSYKSGAVLTEQPYLTYLSGIRMVTLPPDFVKKDPGKQIQVGHDISEYAVGLDDRWQNENPCYKPTTIRQLMRFTDPLAYAPVWTTDGMKDGLGALYPVATPNDWAFTDVVGDF